MADDRELLVGGLSSASVDVCAVLQPPQTRLLLFSTIRRLPLEDES